MDYEKKYKDALERARKVHRNYKNLFPEDSYSEDIEEIFPELAESEDEIHRKWILEYLYDGLRKADEQFKGHFKSAIDWLEKQKEQKPVEWSGEDESCWNLIWDILDGPFKASPNGYRKAADWFIKNCPKGFKSLRPSWKPSEEQMNCLALILSSEAMDDNVHAVITELYEQLKRIKED